MITTSNHKIKTYENKTLKEIKKLHPGKKWVYCRYRGFGDHCIMSDDKEVFYVDDYPMMNRHVKAEKYAYTGMISNIDYSCEVFIEGRSYGNTSKHRATIFFKLRKKGVDIDHDYLTSRRPYTDFTPEASEKAKLKTAINKFVHMIVEESGSHAHKMRNTIRSYAYTHGLEKAKNKYLSGDIQ